MINEWEGEGEEEKVRQKNPVHRFLLFFSFFSSYFLARDSVRRTRFFSRVPQSPFFSRTLSLLRRATKNANQRATIRRNSCWLASAREKLQQRARESFTGYAIITERPTRKSYPRLVAGGGGAWYVNSTSRSRLLDHEYARTIYVSRVSRQPSP